MDVRKLFRAISWCLILLLFDSCWPSVSDVELFIKKFQFASLLATISIFAWGIFFAFFYMVFVMLLVFDIEPNTL